MNKLARSDISTYSGTAAQVREGLSVRCSLVIEQHYSHTVVCRLSVTTGRTDLLRESVNQTLVLCRVTGQRGSQDTHGSKSLDILN